MIITRMSTTTKSHNNYSKKAQVAQKVCLPLYGLVHVALVGCGDAGLMHPPHTPVTAHPASSVFCEAEDTLILCLRRGSDRDSLPGGSRLPVLLSGSTGLSCPPLFVSHLCSFLSAFLSGLCFFPPSPLLSPLCPQPPSFSAVEFRHLLGRGGRQ